ncbi:hypothetical protein R0J90_05000 [Micrococcus sp. SIMBA_144]
MSEPGREPCGSRAEDHPPFQAEAASARAGHPLVPTRRRRPIHTGRTV